MISLGSPHTTSHTGTQRQLHVLVLIVDADGKVVAANSSARTHWVATHPTLVNVPLTALLASPDRAEEEAIDWPTFRQRTLDEWTEITFSDGPLQFRLERSHGGAGTYIATVLAG